MAWRLALALLLLCAACAPARPTAVLSATAGGCAEALRERAAAVDAIDAAEKQALQRSPARAGELQVAASEGKAAVLATADLEPCGRPEPASGGVVVDVGDLRQRYRVVIERSTARLSDIASRPVPVIVPAQRGDRDKDDDKDKKGTKGGKGD